MSHELEHIWSRVQAQLVLVVDESTYRIWLEPLRALELEQEHLLVEAPLHACRWIRERFGRAIQASVELVLGPNASVEIIATSGEDDARRRNWGVCRALRAFLGPTATRALCTSERRPGAGAHQPARQPQADVRPVRDRRLQPSRPRRCAHRRRDARAGLQPAFHLRPARRRQDPPAQLDRDPAARPQPRPNRPLHDRRGLHQRLPRTPSAAATRRRSSSASATSTSCCSTTSSSSSARPRPRRSSSIPSTPYTTAAARSC